MKKFLYDAALRVFRYEELKMAHRKVLYPDITLSKRGEKVAYFGMMALDKVGLLISIEK